MPKVFKPKLDALIENVRSRMVKQDTNIIQVPFGKFSKEEINYFEEHFKEVKQIGGGVLQFSTHEETTRETLERAMAEPLKDFAKIMDVPYHTASHWRYRYNSGNPLSESIINRILTKYK